jgi:predicted DCC family thiol-disulfide oxidoreductase YuxK
VTRQTVPADENVLIYDGDCPFCANYVRLLRLRGAVGPIRLIDARANPIERRAAMERGFDLNQGMLLFMNGQYYHGAECLNRLALLSTTSDIFNRITAVAFRWPAAARISYPILRAGRNLTLRLLGRRKIDY